MYQYDHSVYQTIIKLVVDDWKRAEDYGIEIPGHGKVYPIVLGNKGDWSYLAARHTSTAF